MSLHHDAFPCVVCPEHFPTKTEQAEHLATCHNFDDPWLCHECPMAFTDDDALSSHSAASHPHSVPNGARGGYSCPHGTCGQPLASGEVCERHNKHDHVEHAAQLAKGRQRQCIKPGCEFMNESYVGMSLHVLHQHAPTCVCGMKFAKVLQLAHHRKGCDAAKMQESVDTGPNHDQYHQVNGSHDAAKASKKTKGFTPMSIRPLVTRTELAGPSFKTVALSELLGQNSADSAANTTAGVGSGLNKTTRSAPKLAPAPAPSPQPMLSSSTVHASLPVTGQPLRGSQRRQVDVTSNQTVSEKTPTIADDCKAQSRARHSVATAEIEQQPLVPHSPPLHQSPQPNTSSPLPYDPAQQNLHVERAASLLTSPATAGVSSPIDSGHAVDSELSPYDDAYWDRDFSTPSTADTPAQTWYPTPSPTILGMLPGAYQPLSPYMGSQDREETSSQTPTSQSAYLQQPPLPVDNHSSAISEEYPFPVDVSELWSLEYEEPEALVAASFAQYGAPWTTNGQNFAATPTAVPPRAPPGASYAGYGAFQATAQQRVAASSVAAPLGGAVNASYTNYGAHQTSSSHSFAPPPPVRPQNVIPTPPLPASVYMQGYKDDDFDPRTIYESTIPNKNTYMDFPADLDDAHIFNANPKLIAYGNILRLAQKYSDAEIHAMANKNRPKDVFKSDQVVSSRVKAAVLWFAEKYPSTFPGGVDDVRDWLSMERAKRGIKMRNKRKRAEDDDASPSAPSTDHASRPVATPHKRIRTEDRVSPPRGPRRQDPNGLMGNFYHTHWIQRRNTAQQAAQSTIVDSPMAPNTASPLQRMDDQTSDENV